MNEATITSQLETYLRSVNRGPVIKHADKATIGVPDLSVTGGGQTIWIEVKLVKFRNPKAFDLAKIVNKDGPQYRMMTLLDHHGHSLWVIFFTDGYKWWTVYCRGMAMSGALLKPEKVNLIPTQCESLSTLYVSTDEVGYKVAYTLDIEPGKAFQSVWEQIQQGRRR